MMDTGQPTITLTDRQFKKWLDAMVAQQEVIMTVEEAAEFLRVSKQWIYEHADEIGYRNTAGRKTFTRSGLLAYRDKCTGASLRGTWPRVKAE